MNPKTETKRPPIIAVVGHIDHGKSTLLDYLRKSNIVDQEAGGITQHIGAYEILHKTTEGTERITFIDTPGHEAFAQMRVRGATIADIVILVVSADDKVNVQTIEAIKTIKEAKVPFVVAINKIDKPNADPERIKQELMTNEVYLEGYGGNISNVEISAKTGQGIPELLDTILLMAELEDLKKNDNTNASGVVVEANIDPKKGALATLIIKNGTLKKGDYVIINGNASPVRMMTDSSGKNTDEVNASSPVLVSGFSEIPEVGSDFVSKHNKKEAEQEALDQGKKIKIQEDINFTDKEKIKVILPMIIKSDFLGTLEAVEKEVKKIETDEVKIKIISLGAGTINENDIKFASSHQKPVIIGFNVKVDKGAKDLVEKLLIDEPKIFNIIYDILPYLKEHVAKRMPIEASKQPIGNAKVIKNFGGGKDRQIIGGKVTGGIIAVNKKVNIIRNNKIVDQGTITSLQSDRVKAQEVSEGNQFGSIINSKISIAPGDSLEVLQS